MTRWPLLVVTKPRGCDAMEARIFMFPPYSILQHPRSSTTWALSTFAHASSQFLHKHCAMCEVGVLATKCSTGGYKSCNIHHAAPFMIEYCRYCFEAGAETVR